MNYNTDVASFRSDVHESTDNTLTEYIGLVWRRRWLIMMTAIGCSVAAATWSYMQKSIYQARATIVIEQAGPGALERERYSQQDISPEYFQTHFELMKSLSVLQGAAQRLNLSEQPEYKPRPPGILRTLAGQVVDYLPADMREWWNPMGSSVPAESASHAEDLLLMRFGQQIDIMPVRGARLAYITVSSEDPEFSASAANTLASVYIDRTQELSSESKEKAAKWFTDHLDELRKKVEESQKALYLFRSQYGLLDGHERQAVAAQKLAELNSELIKAEMKKAEAHTRFQQTRSLSHSRTADGSIDWSSLDASTEVLSSPLIQGLRTQEVRLSGQVAELTDKYGPLHPKMARAKAELADLHERIQKEIQKIYDSVKGEYEVSVARERAIRDAVNRYKKDKIKVEQYEIEYGMLEREAQSSQHLYDIFLKVTKEADLSAGIRTSNVYLADPAVPNWIPVKPKKRLNTVLGFIVGLMAGVGTALFLETRDRSLKGPTDVERYLPKTSLLGVVPLLPKTADTKEAWLPASRPFTLAAESFRTIRTSLLLSGSGCESLPSCVLITSPGESEGKTTLAVNLAVTMAQLEDFRMILIDGDLRQSGCHSIFCVPNGDGPPKGLVHFLTGEADVRDIIHQTNIPNLSVIPRGYVPSNPSELLHSKHMGTLLRSLREKDYHVILDAPPVLPVTDPVVLAPKVDGVLLVASAGATTREACRTAIQRVTNSGGRFLGIVLQKARITDFRYYAGQYHRASNVGSFHQWISRLTTKQ